MSDLVVKVENLSKQYRLGTVGTGTLSHDLNRMWALLRGKADPYQQLGEVNDREKIGSSDYVWALRDVNFELKKGEVLGVIGKNGAGKSTLLKILSQITLPTKGKISIKGRIGALLEVGTGFHPELTGRENVFLNGAILGMRKSEIQQKFDEIVEFAGVANYIDTPVKRYSSGMKVRLGFAVAAHLEPEILIVDEVLAVGDYLFQKKCLGKLDQVGKEGRTIIFVSHNLNVLSSLCNRAIHIDKGSIVDSGIPGDVIAKYLNSQSSTGGAFRLSLDYSKRAQVVSAQLFNNKNEPTEVVTLGEKTYLELEVFFRDELVGGHIAIIVYDGMNNHIVSLADTDQDLSKYSVKRIGSYKYRVDIPTHIFNEGRFQIFCGIGIPGQDVLFRKELFTFQVVASGTFEEMIVEGGKRSGILMYKSFWEELSK